MRYPLGVVDRHERHVEPVHLLLHHARLVGVESEALTADELLLLAAAAPLPPSRRSRWPSQHCPSTTPRPSIVFFSGTFSCNRVSTSLQKKKKTIVVTLLQRTKTIVVACYGGRFSGRQSAYNNSAFFSRAGVGVESLYRYPSHAHSIMTL